MIRFVDLRFQGTGYRFAFFDTCTDTFLGINGYYAWGTKAEFKEDTTGSLYQERCLNLCPDWIETPPSDNEMYGFDKEDDFFEDHA